MDRLELQHLLWMELLGGRLHLAPLQKINVTHALDVGCGTGSMQPFFFILSYFPSVRPYPKHCELNDMHDVCSAQ